MDDRSRAHFTLVGTTVLHAFTHAYATMFLPLYVMMQTGLHLQGAKQAGFVVTVYGLVYWGLSYPAGVLADRYDRRMLLGVGLLGNALAVIGIGAAGSYATVLACAAFGGVFGSLFHPCANALIPAHYPKSPGTAIGLLGIGSGLGFFLGPAYAGWAAQRGVLAGAPADWQRPAWEMGVAGLVVGVAYLLCAREAGSHHAVPKPLLPADLRKVTVTHASIVAMREFAGVGLMSLAALYLLTAMKFDTQRTGRVLGTSLLFAAVVNPVTVYLSGGVWRLRVHVGVLALGAIVIASVPLWGSRMVLPVLIVAQSLTLVSSAVTDAALTERVPPMFRGRVNGMYLTLVGGAGALSPFGVGWVVDGLKARAAEHGMSQGEFFWPFGGLALIFLCASASLMTFRRMAEVTGMGGNPARSMPDASPVPVGAAEI